MTRLISGGAKGVERLAEKYAEDTELDKHIVRPNIKMHGYKSAFFIRNTEILGMCDSLIVFWDGTEQSIVDVLSHAMKIKIEVNLVPMI